MKILILSSNPDLDSTKQLAKSFHFYSQKVEVINPADFHFSFSPAQIFLRKKIYSKPDLVIPRFGWKSYHHGIRVLEAFESQGVECLNAATAIRKSYNKLQTFSTLEKYRIPLPKTFYFDPSQNSFPLPMQPPLILKTIQGSQGWGVTLAETKVQAESMIQQLRTVQAEFLIQEFIQGSEIRVLIYKKQILGAMERTPAKGEFRSNLHLGGKGRKIKLTHIEVESVLAAARALQLDLAGVDFIRSPMGLKILEVNPFPGLSGISKVLKTQFAKKIAKDLLQR